MLLIQGHCSRCPNSGMGVVCQLQHPHCIQRLQDFGLNINITSFLSHLISTKFTDWAWCDFQSIFCPENISSALEEQKSKISINPKCSSDQTKIQFQVNYLYHCQFTTKVTSRSVCYLVLLSARTMFLQDEQDTFESLTQQNKLPLTQFFVSFQAS